jgi:cytoskeleton protein RodZ
MAEIDTLSAPTNTLWDEHMEEQLAKGAFGESLKREREMRGITLQEVSAATRIAVRFLQAIETEQWDQLPGGVFNRGFVRAVAHYLGLDEESVLAEYGLVIGEHPTTPVWTGRPPAAPPERHGLAWILAVMAVATLSAGGWFGTHRYLSLRTARRTAQLAAASAATDAGALPAPPASETNSTIPALPSPPDPVATPDARAPVVPFGLKLEAIEETQVTVESDGHRVFNRPMKGGETHRFTAQDKFQVSAADAGALLLQLDGQVQAPLGPSGRPGTMTLTRDALPGAAGGVH